MATFRRLTNLFRRSHVNREIDAELEFKPFHSLPFHCPLIAPLPPICNSR